jgi:PAS domain S-box-containing protein
MRQSFKAIQEKIMIGIKKNKNFQYMPFLLRIFIILSICILFSVQISAEELSREEKEYLKKKGKIVFIHQTNYAPFEFVDETGSHTGMCVELVQWIRTELGFRAVFVDSSFKDAREAIQSGRADVLTSLFYSEKRDKSFDFTPVLFDVPASIFVLSERPDIHSISDLENKKIAMQSGDYAREFLDSKGIDVKVIWTKSFGEATDLVVTGKADAIIGDEQIVLYHLYENELTDKIKKVGKPLYIGRNCMAVKESNTILMSILRKGIKRARESGKLENINQIWLGTHYGKQKSFFKEYFSYIIGIGCAFISVVFIVFFWNLYLRRIVERRTKDLKKSKERYQTLVGNIPVGIYRSTPGENGRFLMANSAIVRMFGYDSIEDFLRIPVNGIYSDPSRREKFLKKLMSQNEVVSEELQFIKLDGSTLWGSVTAKVIRDESGDILYVDGLVEDITEYKHTAEYLARAENIYREVIEKSSGVPYRLSQKQKKYEYFGEGIKSLVGISAEDMNFEKLIEMIIETDISDPGWHGDLDSYLMAFSKGEIDNFKADIHILTADGIEKWLHDSAIPVYDENTGELIASIGILQDITDRKREENEHEALQRLTHRLSGCMSVKDVCLTVVDEAKILFDYDSISIFNFNLEDNTILNLYNEDILPGKDEPEYIEMEDTSITVSLISGMSKPILINRNKIPEKSEYITFGDEARLSRSLMFVPIRREDQTVGKMTVQSYTPYKYKEDNLIFFQEFADQCGAALSRSQAEEAFQESEERFKRMVSNIPGIVCRCENDADLTMLFISDAIEELSGYPAGDFINNKVRSFASIIHPDDIEIIDQSIFSSILENRPFTIEYRIIDSKENTHWVFEKGKGVRGDDGKVNCLDCAIFDITDRKRIEDERESLRDLMQHLTGCKSIREVCLSVVQTSRQLFNHDALSISDINWNEHTAVSYYSEDTFKDSKGPVEVPTRPESNIKNSISDLMIPKLINRKTIPVKLESLPFGDESRLSRSIMNVPIRQEGVAVGQLSVQSYTEGKYSHKDLGLLQIIADNCGIALARTKAQKALQESRKNLRKLFDTIDDFLFVLDTDGKIIQSNPAVESLGYSPDDLVGKTLVSLYPAEMQYESAQIMNGILNGELTVSSIPLTRKNGETVHVETIFSQGIWYGQDAIYGVSRDITERKKAENEIRLLNEELEKRVERRTSQLAASNKMLQLEIIERKDAEKALKASSQRLSGVVGAIVGNISMMDENMDIVWTNKIAQNWFGEDIIGKKCYAAYYKKKSPCIPCLVLKTFQDGEVHEQERPVLDKEGKNMHLWCTTNVAEYHSDGRPKLVVEVSLDITDRKRAEEEIKRHRDHLEEIVAARTQDLSRANADLQLEIMEKKQAENEMKGLRNFLKNVIDSMPSVLVGIDTEGHITQWNREAENVTGVKAQDAHGRTLYDAFPMLAIEMDKVRKAIRERTPQKDEKISSMVNGETRFSDLTIYPLITNGISGAVIRIDDVTERIRIEEMMIQSEKMLSVGGLAAGIAHEINNPLAGILQNIQVIQNRITGDLPANKRVAEKCGVTMDVIKTYIQRRNVISMIESVMESGKRASSIVENMLSFSRKSDAIASSHDLRDLLDKTVELASNDYDLKKKYDFRIIKIVREYEKSTPPIPCEKTKIQQVFLNILKNGAQAMIDNKAKSKIPQFILRIKTEEDMICIEIEDNGSGMEENVRKRVFEPFYTTKDVGIGTGLGLSVSYFIITENHGGTLSVNSTPGQGTTFVIKLPVKKGYKSHD